MALGLLSSVNLCEQERESSNRQPASDTEIGDYIYAVPCSAIIALESNEQVSESFSKTV